VVLPCGDEASVRELLAHLELCSSEKEKENEKEKEQ